MDQKRQVQIQQRGSPSSTSKKGKGRKKGETEVQNLICGINYEGIKRKGVGKARQVSFQMKVKILSWNIRGLNDWDKRSTITSLVRKWKADILCLQETKMENIPTNMLYQIWGK